MSSNLGLFPPLFFFFLILLEFQNLYEQIHFYAILTNFNSSLMPNSQRMVKTIYNA